MSRCMELQPNIVTAISYTEKRGYRYFFGCILWKYMISIPVYSIMDIVMSIGLKWARNQNFIQFSTQFLLSWISGIFSASMNFMIFGGISCIEIAQESQICNPVYRALFIFDGMVAETKVGNYHHEDSVIKCLDWLPMHINKLQ